MYFRGVSSISSTLAWSNSFLVCDSLVNKDGDTLLPSSHSHLSDDVHIDTAGHWLVHTLLLTWMTWSLTRLGGNPCGTLKTFFIFSQHRLQLLLMRCTHPWISTSFPSSLSHLAHIAPHKSMSAILIIKSNVTIFVFNDESPYNLTSRFPKVNFISILVQLTTTSPRVRNQSTPNIKSIPPNSNWKPSI